LTVRDRLNSYPGTFSVRPATDADLDTLTRFKGPVALHRDRLRDMASGDLQYFVVESDAEPVQLKAGSLRKEIIGYGMIVVRWPETWSDLPHQDQLPVLVDLFIEPGVRGKGAGTFLIHKFEEYAVSRGCRRLYLSVDPVENPRTHQLYLRLGYLPLQEEPYLDDWEFTDSDNNIHRGKEMAIDMVKELSEGTENSALLSNIEVIHPGILRRHIRHALFDFDGTVSLIRQGWQEVMIPMMVEVLLQTPDHESVNELYPVVREFVELLTGKQTIYQMIRLAEEVTKRGGVPLDPLEYKKQYLELINMHIADRIAGLKAGRIIPEQMMVPGVATMLEALRERGVILYLASGTDEVYVKEEAAALDITGYFCGIYGARDDYKSFSKKIVIDRILAENQLSGPDLVSFGDGYVEIENTVAAGGIAVGVASDEVSRQGIDAWKRQRLISAGADIIIPDFRPWRELVAYLFEEDG
jgi:phosphoglycolate phosphatase